MGLTVEKVYDNIVNYMSTTGKTVDEALLVYGSEILLLAQDKGFDNVIKQLMHKKEEKNI